MHRNASVIVCAKRTPIGSFLGNLSSVSAPQLAAKVILQVITETGIEKQLIDEVILGQVLSAGVGQAPSRQAALAAGLSTSIPCTTVNKVCGSGLKAIMLADQALKNNDVQCILAGGMESMSNAPYLLTSARTGFRMGDNLAIDSILRDGLTNPIDNQHMGNFGEQCASEFGFSRQEQDDYALESYRRALAATENNLFANEIVPIFIETKSERIVVNKDEELTRFRPEKFAQLKAAFKKDGSITAANASKLNDGAAIALVCKESFAIEKKLAVQGRIVATASFAQEPERFTTAPIKAIEKVLKKANRSLQDVDLFEINEAFSVVALVVMKQLKIPHDKVNIFGGAVALGHPIGCSGARIIATLLNAMHHKNARLGCAAICLGGGEAVAMLVER